MERGNHMRKLFALVMLTSLMAAGCAWADPRITFTVYKCMVCDKEFYGFPGDPPLDDKKFKDTPEQLKRMFKFVDYGSKNLNQCKNGFKTHIFDKKGTKDFTVSSLTRFSWAENVVVFKDGGALNNVKLTTWECVYCKKPFYSINDENLNIRDWEQQGSYVMNLKGRGLQKCPKPGVLGHAFYLKSTGSVSSYNLAKKADDIYWVK